MCKPLIILLSSITYAIKSKELLNKNGFKSELKRVPKNVKYTGCSYGVYVPENTDKAIEILKRSGIKIIGRVEEGD